MYGYACEGESLSLKNLVLFTSLNCVCSKYLEMDITFPEDMTDRYGDMVAKHVTVVVDKFRRVFFVDDAIETLKVC